MAANTLIGVPPQATVAASVPQGSPQASVLPHAPQAVQAVAQADEKQSQPQLQPPGLKIGGPDAQSGANSSAPTMNNLQPPQQSQKQSQQQQQQQQQQRQPPAAAQASANVGQQSAATATSPKVPSASASPAVRISMILMQQSGRTCRISFDYDPKLYSFEAVGRLLKHTYRLQDAVGKLKLKIQNEYEALKKGEDRSTFVEEDIAIMDDADFLINRDMQQEILYKQIQRLKNQIRESESHTLDQWRAIDDEHKRHESELSRIENARQEATEQRRKRLLENQEKEAGAAEAAGEPSPAPQTGPAEATAESDRKPAAKTEAATLVRRDSKFDANESVAEQRAPQVGQIMSEKQNSSENLF